jgi:UDP-N-acetylmuramoyl-L-alanyl-D-glutamate--2,6-diaminopimelate ligase
MTGKILIARLDQLFTQIPVKIIAPSAIPPVTIRSIALDSRRVQPGDLFVALVGGNTDGHRYIPAAIANGAAAVIGSKPVTEVNSPVPYVQVEDTRLALAHISAAFNGFPARSMTVIGVTGTDGKTTTSNLIYQILLAAGLRAGIISTVNAVIGDRVIDTGFHVTTPEAPEVQSYLRQMKEAGVTHVVLEATSHGLAQHRVTACEFDIAVVTNITHEHLDYHGSYEGYREAKAMLFRHLEETVEKAHGNPRLAVLNRDDRSFDFLNGLVQGRKATYSLEQEADARAEDIRYGPTGLHFTAVVPGGERFEVDSSLLGAYNISNILAALAATLIGLGIEPAAAREGILAMKAVPGRMERIDLGQNFLAIVDFAHTPNALKVALETARQMTGGRVIAVFGSAGLRDREKRRLMAEVSARLADVTILTAEDPRTESLEDILAEMARAAESQGGQEGETFFRVPDRGGAIRLGVQMARPGDLVIACGKGHEQSMCFGETEYPWDDRTAMRAALAESLGLAGFSMPFLPTQE